LKQIANLKNDALFDLLVGDESEENVVDIQRTLRRSILYDQCARSA
jgi:hypothetical protein